MTFSEIMSLIAKSENTTVLLFFSIAAIGIFVIREIVKLRKEVHQITTEKFTERKNAVLEVFKTLDELKKHDIKDFELKAIKEQFLRDLNLHISVENITNAGNQAQQESRPTRTYIPDNIFNLSKRERVYQFFGGLFLFGFMAVWSAGWATGTTTFGVIGISYQIGPLWQAFSDLSLFEIIWRIFALLLTVAIYCGIGIVPTVMALAGVIGGVLGMSTAIWPSLANISVIRGLDKKLLRWG